MTTKLKKDFCISNEWTQHHTDLQNLLKKEIDTMRELLGNLYQEEMFIVQKEMAYWNQLMEERGHLIQHLSNLRQDRMYTTQILEAMNSSHANVPLEELVPIDNLNSSDLLALRDQMLALIDRMNLQCSRNEMLSQLAHHQASFQHLPEKKTKVSIATLPPEYYNNKDACS